MSDHFHAPLDSDSTSSLTDFDHCTYQPAFVYTSIGGSQRQLPANTHPSARRRRSIRTNCGPLRKRAPCALFRGICCRICSRIGEFTVATPSKMSARLSRGHVSCGTQ